MIYRAILLSLLVSAAAAAQSGGFVVTLGTDTVQIERFARRGNRVEGTVVTRSPTTVIRKYVLELGRSNELLKYEVRLLRPDGSPIRAGGQPATMTRDGDSLTRHSFRNEELVTHRMAAPLALMPGPSLPYVGAPVLLYELGFAHSRKEANPDGAAALYEITFTTAQTRPTATPLWFIGRDSVELDYFGVTRRGFKLDSKGALIRADWSRSTYKYRMQRIKALDVEAYARRWSAADAQGRAMGAYSPRDTMRASVGDIQIAVAYSRPSKRGRVVWGGLVPWDSVWRFGADVATQLTLGGDLQFGETRLPAGSYSLWMLPSERGTSLLVVNKQANTWGTAYNRAQDLVRIPLERLTPTGPVERFSLSVEGEQFRIQWDNRGWSIPIRAVQGSVVAQGLPVLSPASLTLRVPPLIVNETCQTMAYTDTSTTEFPCSGWSIERTTVDGVNAVRLRIGKLYESVVDASNLRPLSTRYVTPRDSFDVRFASGKATGWMAWGGRPHREVGDDVEGAFLAVVVEHLLGTLPLSPSYEAIVPLYAPYGQISRDTLRVTGVDSVQVRGLSHLTWRVELIAPRGPNRSVRTFWVDQRTGRLLKRENRGLGGTARVVQTVR